MTPVPQPTHRLRTRTAPRRRTATRGLTAALALVAALSLAACSGGTATPEKPAETTVSVATKHGPVTVPVNPKRVVALDSTSFQTLLDWGITPVALPKKILPHTGFEKWMDDDGIVDIGNHKSPDLEALSQVKADLVISGYRFSEYDDQIAQMDIGPVIDIAADRDGDGGFVGGLRTETTTLGAIFDRANDAQRLNAQLNTAITDTKAKAQGKSVFLGAVTGGKIDNAAQRLDPFVAPLDMKDVFAGEGGDIHKDSGLAPETIAAKNPDWAIVMDRDAALGTADAKPAQAVFDAQEAFAHTTFAAKHQILILDSDFYLNEGIQKYTSSYVQLGEALSAH